MLETAQILQERYQLQQQLGNNGGRQTWLATDVKASPPSPVIVKLLAFSPQMQWEELKLFEREAQILKQLNHPRIPQYRDYFSLDKETGAGLCWFGLVQEYIPGSSLAQLLDSGRRFTESQVRDIATQILEILIYLHGLNPPVLHRDIKPSNLILAENNQIYLVDFGAVQNTAAVEGVTFTVVGTTGYAPLEQFWGQAVPASDLYALGATLIHLLTGMTPAELPQRNLRIQFKEQVSISANFISWIEAMTEPDIELRLSSAIQALAALETGESISYRLSTIRPPFRTKIQLKKSRSHLRIKIPGAGILILGNFIVFAAKLIFLFTVELSLIIVIIAMVSSLTMVLLVMFTSPTNPEIISWLLVTVVSEVLLYLLVRSGDKESNKIHHDLNRTRFPAFGNKYISFDRNQFVIEHRYLRIDYSRQRGQISDIMAIGYRQRDGSIFLRSPQRKYCLGKKLTGAEGEWLVREIKEWLAD